MVAKAACDLLSLAADAVGALERLGVFDVAVAIADELATGRFRQDFLVGRHPLKTRRRYKRHHGVRYGAFRRPQADRLAPEQPLVQGNSARQLLRGVFRMTEPFTGHA